MGKQFTAMAVMMLVEEGKLQLQGGCRNQMIVNWLCWTSGFGKLNRDIARGKVPKRPG